MSDKRNNSNKSDDTGGNTVSVVIPAYNSENYICRTLDSVLSQSCAVDEIIVVDDGSSDDTAKLVGQYVERYNTGQSDVRIRYIYQENAGPGAARNTGIEAAMGKWVAFLDHDDEWLARKNELQLGLIKKNPDLVWVSGNYIRCMCGQERREVYVDANKAQELLGGRDYYSNFCDAIGERCYGCSDTIMVRKSVLKEAGMFEGGLLGEDLDLWLRIAYLYPQMGFVVEPLAVYHLGVQGSLASRRWRTEDEAAFIERHLELAAKYNRLQEFEPYATVRVRAWLRSSMFDERINDIRPFMAKFGKLLGRWYRCKIWLLTVWPALTMRVCKMLSRLVRMAGVKRKLFHPVEAGNQE